MTSNVLILRVHSTAAVGLVSAFLRTQSVGDSILPLFLLVRVRVFVFVLCSAAFSGVPVHKAALP